PHQLKKWNITLFKICLKSRFKKLPEKDNTYCPKQPTIPGKRMNPFTLQQYNQVFERKITGNEGRQESNDQAPCRLCLDTHFYHIFNFQQHSTCNDRNNHQKRKVGHFFALDPQI